MKRSCEKEWQGFFITDSVIFISCSTKSVVEIVVILKSCIFWYKFYVASGTEKDPNLKEMSWLAWIQCYLQFINDLNVRAIYILANVNFRLLIVLLFSRWIVNEAKEGKHLFYAALRLVTCYLPRGHWIHQIVLTGNEIPTK